jgi:hypothetical protein
MASLSGIRLLTIVAVAISIAPTVDAQQRREYRRGSVIAGGERFQAEKLVLTSDSLRFVVKGSGQPKSYPLSQVEYATRVRTHARDGALAGGGLMLLGGLLGVAQAESDPNVEVRDNAATIVTALTAGGVLLGAIIGNALKSEKTIIQNGRMMTTLGFDLQISRDSANSERALFHVVARF